MAKVSDVDIARAAAAAGFTKDELPTAVAVALAESGGNATATYAEANGTTSYGLWQINSVHGGLLQSGDWRDPGSNARMAYQVFVGANRTWKPWGAYNKGRHLLYMPRGVAAAALVSTVAGGSKPATDDPGNASAGGGVLAVANPLDVIGDVREALSDIGFTLKFITDPHSWVRVAAAATGAGLLLMAMWPVIKPGVKTAAKVGVKAATKGAV